MSPIFLDFDGVIIDSVKECFLVSKELFLELEPKKKIDEEHEKLFFKYRGIVGPAWQFIVLHQAINSHLSKDPEDLRILFHNLCQVSNAEENKRTENAFFEIRKKYQSVPMEWFMLNPITEYGKFLQNRELINYHIVTTKNRDAVEQLLKHYQIEIFSIYDVEDYRRSKNKGVLLSTIMDKHEYQKAVFVDDSVTHLDSVYDPRIECYFADWGYGENTTYPVYNKKFWR